MATSMATPQANRPQPGRRVRRYGDTAYAGSQYQPVQRRQPDPYAGGASTTDAYDPGYDAGGPQTYFPDLTTGDAYDRFRQDRTMAIDRGNRIDADLSGEAVRRANLENRYRGRMDNAYGDLAANPGYTADERAGIMQYGSTPTPLTQEQIDSFQLREDEQAAIMGNPNAQRGWFNPGQTEGIANEQGGRVRGAIGDWRTSAYGTYGEGAGATRSAIDNAQLGPSEEYSTGQGAAITGARRGVSNYLDDGSFNLSGDYTGAQDRALGGGASAVRSFTGDPSLRVSGEYMDRANFTPEDEQRMVQSAATSVGNNTRAVRDRVEREAAGSGMSPLALAAGLQELQTTGDIAAQDAMLDAEVRARQIGIDAATQRENTRLGAEQYRTGQGTQSELALQRAELNAAGEREGMRSDLATRRAGYGTSAALNLAGQALNAIGEREGFRAAGERDRMGARVNNERDLMRAGIGIAGDTGAAEANAEMQIGDRRQDANRFNQTAGMNMERDIDNTYSDRARGIAENRQGVSIGGQTGQFNQGMGYSSAMSNRTGAVADARRQDQGEYRGWTTNQTNQQGAFGQNARGQRISNYGTQGGLTNQSSGQYGQYDLGRRGQGFRSNFMGSLGRSLGNFAVYGQGG